MTNYSSTIGPGIQLGKENGLTLLLDAEVYDYAFSPQKGEEHYTKVIQENRFLFKTLNTYILCTTRLQK